ncbi:MAG: M48 family metalloprotease [Planctomycetes bacterium]|nr:M48 family metalloprotease [Planctomycetota bacterium]
MQHYFFVDGATGKDFTQLGEIVDESVIHFLTSPSMRSQSAQDMATTLYDTIDGLIERNVSTGRFSPADVSDIRFLLFFVSLVLFVVPILLFTFQDLLRFVRSCETWRVARCEQRLSPRIILPSSDLSIASRLDHAVIWFFFVVSGALHWSCVIVACDVTTFIVTGQCLLIRPLGTVFALVYMNTQNLPAPSMCRALITMMLLLLAMPGASSLALGLWRVLELIQREWTFTLREPRRCQLDAERFGLLCDACKEQNVRVSSLQLIWSSKSNCSIFSETSLLSLGSRIVISERLKKQLNEPELQALIAHEIHHLKGDALRLARLTLLSDLFLFPSRFLLILYDFSEHELEADAFAVSILGDAEPMIAALTKLSVFAQVGREKATGGGHESSRARAYGGWRGVVSLIVDSSFSGAAYPFLQLRLARLKSLESN